MIGKTFSLLVSLIGLAAFAYVYFCVPLSKHTLYEHTKRVLATEAAQDLGQEATEAAARVKGALIEDNPSAESLDAGTTLGRK